MSNTFDLLQALVLRLDQECRGWGQTFLNEWQRYTAATAITPTNLITFLSGFWRMKIAVMAVDNMHELYQWLDDRSDAQSWMFGFDNHVLPEISFLLTAGGWA